MSGVREPLAVAWPERAGEMWSGAPLVPLPHLVAPALRARPDATAILFEDGVRVTRGALLEATSSFAAYLATRIERGDRVAVAIGNRAEFFVAWLGTIAAGGVVVQMNPAAGPHDAEHMLHDSGARLAVADAAAASVLRDAAARCPALAEVLVVDDAAAEPHGLAALSAGLAPLELDAVDLRVEDPASIYYTSGTTGAPKGCISVHGGFVRYVDLVGRLYPLSAEDRVLNPLQFFYGDAIWLFFAALRADAELVSVRRFSVSRFWDVVARHETTVLLGIGAIPSLLLTAEPSAAERDHAMRMALQIGVPPNQHAELVERFGFPWVELYGQAESGVTIAMPADASERYVGTGAIGVPVPEVQVRLVDDAGAEVAGPGAGELHVRAPFMMREYLGRPDATAETIGPDGWLRTGDRARRDEDGVHYFLGRKKELIRRGGENIAPFEVEAVLRLHDAVVDAAVVPVADALRGEEVKAYVELKPGAAVAPPQLVDFCAERLARHKVPRYVELREEPFPRTPSQRIRKSELMVDGVHATASAWDREEDRR